VHCINFAFAAGDRSGDGYIELKESRLFFCQLMLTCEARETFDELRVDKSKAQIDFIDFANGVSVMKDYLGVTVVDPAAEFAKMDHDNDGTVDMVEFCYWVGTIRFRDAATLKDLARGREIAKFGVAQVYGAGTNAVNGFYRAVDTAEGEGALTYSKIDGTDGNFRIVSDAKGWHVEQDGKGGRRPLLLLRGGCWIGLRVDCPFSDVPIDMPHSVTQHYRVHEAVLLRLPEAQGERTIGRSAN
jgi:hypothetical protein